MAVAAEHGQVTLGRGPKTILHIIPFAAFAPGVSFNIKRLADKPMQLTPIAGGYFTHRINFDGILGSSPSDEGHLLHSGVPQGIIEAVDTRIIRQRNGKKLIPGHSWDGQVLAAVDRYTKIQTVLGLEPPLVVLLTLADVAGYEMHTGQSFDCIEKPEPIEVYRSRFLGQLDSEVR